MSQAETAVRSRPGVQGSAVSPTAQ